MEENPVASIQFDAQGSYKKTMLDNLNQSLNAYAQFLISRNAKNLDQFKTWLVIIYLNIEPKIAKAKDAKFKELDELKTYLQTPRALPTEKAIHYLQLIRQLYEVLGITGAETEKVVPTGVTRLGK